MMVRHMCDRVAVMYLGKIAEIGSGQDLFRNPRHPYTKALLSAIPIPDPVIEATRERIVITGELPSPMNPPTGCVFHTRCPIATNECQLEIPGYDDEEARSLIKEGLEISKEKVQNCLKPDGIFCMEMKKQSIMEPHIRIKYYGDTQVVFWKEAA